MHERFDSQAPALQCWRLSRSEEVLVSMDHSQSATCQDQVPTRNRRFINSTPQPYPGIWAVSWMNACPSFPQTALLMSLVCKGSCLHGQQKLVPPSLKGWGRWPCKQMYTRYSEQLCRTDLTLDVNSQHSSRTFRTFELRDFQELTS